MKFLLSLFLALGALSPSVARGVKPKRSLSSSSSGPVRVADIKADSSLGQKVLGKARRLENQDEIDFTWVADFSIKFQGCHHIKQWNDEADGEEDVRIQTKRLIRFRLCESSACSAESAGGCSSGYGDYIIDMNEFLQVYYEAVEEKRQYDCEYLMNTQCDCEDDDGKGDDFDRDFCEYDCYADNGMEYCADNNPYNDDEQEEEEEFRLDEYVECQQIDLNQDNNGRRRRAEEEEIQYFVGPYCSEQGGAIYLGVFTDDTCSTFDEEDTYYKTMGKRLPYSSQSVITMDCFSCKELEDVDQQNNNDGNNNNNNDQNDEDLVIEMCEQIYSKAGKCEQNLPSGTAYEPNNNACNYISGIKVARHDGIITQVGSKANKTASVFIGIFVVAFVLLAAYVYYLKTKLDRASINLSE